MDEILTKHKAALAYLKAAIYAHELGLIDDDMLSKAIRVHDAIMAELNKDERGED